MAPQSAAKGPQGKLLQAIEKTYGKFDSFKAEFEKMGTTLFGSGWVWLVSNSSGELKIVQTQNAENPMRQQLTPLFTCDVWEHAYYIDYRNARAKYLSKFWEVLNWEFAGKNFEKIK
jgi:Fe-Mn family superoxide dismutase